VGDELIEHLDIRDDLNFEMAGNLKAHTEVQSAR